MPQGRLKQSVEYIQFFTSIGAAALVTWVVWRLVEEPMAYAETNAQLPMVQNSNGWLSILVDNLPLMFLFIAGMGALSYTVFRSTFR